MFYLPSQILRRVREYGQYFFYHFGRHCATHQIRVILICAVVITSLFYPALAAAGHTLFRISTALDDDGWYVDIPAEWSGGVLRGWRDTMQIWAGHPSLLTSPQTPAYCYEGAVVRAEQLLLDSTGVNLGSLKQALISIQQLQGRLQDAIDAQQIPCIRAVPLGDCLTLSPLLFWDARGDDLHANSSVAGVPIRPEMVTASRLNPRRPLQSAEYLVLTYFLMDTQQQQQRATWLNVVRAAARDMHAPGQKPIQVRLQEQQDLSLLGLDLARPPAPRHAQMDLGIISAFIYVVYALFLAYLTWSMRRMDGVHSRMGLTFTATVEIVVSTIASLSICALVGFEISLVPGVLLPILIVFIGAEHMINIVDTVTKTNVALPVRERLAQGLSRAGTSNTLKLITYNSILGVIAGTSDDGVIRQFTTFAIVVLVAHWFLAHTFFATVLSIDMSRLELQEMLSLRQDGLDSDHNTKRANPIRGEDKRDPSDPFLYLDEIGRVVERFLHGRATKNFSLMLLLATITTLYYAKAPVLLGEHWDPLDTDPAVLASSPLTFVSEEVKDEAAVRIWQLLNPNLVSPFCVAIQTPVILSANAHWKTAPSSLGDGDSGFLTAFVSFVISVIRFPLRLFFYHPRTFRLLAWIFKIMVLPISFTTFLLWRLLLYLLKNAELLEAYHEGDGEYHIGQGSYQATVDEKHTSLEGHMTFSTLPRTFVSDVEMIASSADGRVVASVGARNEIALWKLADEFDFCQAKGKAGPRRACVDVSEVLSRPLTALARPPASALLLPPPALASTSRAAYTVTSIALSHSGEYLAVGTGAGLLAVWLVKWDLKDSFSIGELVGLMAIQNINVGIVSIHFAPPPDAGRRSLSRTPPPNLSRKQTSCAYDQVAIVTYEGGNVVKWRFGKDEPTASFITPTSHAPVTKASVIPFALPFRHESRILVAHHLEDGMLELTDVTHSDTEVPVVPPGYRVCAGTSSDNVVQVHVCSMLLGFAPRLILACATGSGVVSLWDGSTQDLITVLDDSFGRISQLRVAPVQCTACRFCGHLPMESFSVVFSTGYALRFFDIHIEDEQTQRCACTRSTLIPAAAGASSVHRHGRCSSNASQTDSPTRSRKRPVTSADKNSPAPFPVSAHGVHSRRASEKNLAAEYSNGNSRRGSMDSASSLNLYYADSDRRTHDAIMMAYTGETIGPSNRSFWLRATPLLAIEAVCERGCWEASDTGVFGFKRRARAKNQAGHVAGRHDIFISSERHPGVEKKVGLTAPVLDRWEVWKFDPALPVLRSSTLAALSASDEGECRAAQQDEEDTPRLPFTRVSPLTYVSRAFDLSRRSEGLSGTRAGDFLSERYTFSENTAGKITKGVSCLLMRQSTGEELARYVHASPKECLSAGEKRPTLRIYPSCDINIEFAILRFVPTHGKKHRDRMGDGTSACARDEDPQGDGGGTEGGGG
ncbi:hypothetical protein FISHEDRAFT_73871 [Fistulina hepatica ATCC 64428]|uniref:Sterol regulatory element-binding protein cleavage-activating protein n=1 Tax=Fistulina hepatica ATCC 64428 TaxID=1128425 RepID=A0A0D7ABV2_9AGAR|nr:hypothetical protein FISHEDRAFT_73871 [Fistulina hepatica ATCC 64428]